MDGVDATAVRSAARVGAVRCGRFVDVDAGTIHEDWSLRVEDGIVAEVGPWDARAGGEEHVLDLSGLTVVPGLVDCHDHLGFDFGNLATQVDRGETWATLRAVRNGRGAIADGITTLREAGSFAGLAMLWRTAIEAGYMPGPSLRAAGQWITPTGGHVWFVGRQADGVEEVRRAVREQVRDGADWIKLIATGGILGNSGNGVESVYSRAEVQAAVDEAHALGLAVAAHAHGGPGLEQAIAAGVDAIEHGTEASASQLERMAQQGISLVATPGVLRLCATAPGIDVRARGRAASMQERYLQALADARETGVRVAVGTDLLHGRLVDEMEILVEAGYSRAEAMRAATASGADIAGAEGAGRLVAGGRGDFLAVRGDPLVELATLREPVLVVKDGLIELNGSADERTVG